MVYDEKGWTKEAMELAKEVHEALGSVIDKYQKDGMSPEAIMYVVNSEIVMICLSNRLRYRGNK